MKLLVLMYQCIPRPLRIIVAVPSFKAVSLLTELFYVSINFTQISAANHIPYHHRIRK